MFVRLIVILLIIGFTGCGRARHTSTPKSVFITEHSYAWICSWDNSSRNDTIRIYKPREVKSPLPVIIFHHGRGLGYHGYDVVLSEVAASGAIVASVSDDISFINGVEWNEPRVYTAPLVNYDLISPGLGMISASYAIEEALEQIMQIESFADRNRVFFVGHSRGGGGVEICHARNSPVRGFGYLMAFDVYGWVPMPTQLPPSRVLVVAATLDNNLGFTETVGITNHLTGAYNLNVIYGGNHDYISDFVTDGIATITREDEQAQIAGMLISFVHY